MGVTELILSYKCLKLKLRVVLAGHIVAINGNLLCHKINSNLFPDDWAVCWYHDFNVNKYRVVVMIHQTQSLEKYWKLFSATLTPLFRFVWFSEICLIEFFRNQQYEHDSDRITPLGAGFDGVNFPLRKTGQNELLDKSTNVFSLA